MVDKLEVGDEVRVPWGSDRSVAATILEVWGDPPQHVRVMLHLDGSDEGEEPIVILVSPAVLTAA